jgi:hypothetical protein
MFRALKWKSKQNLMESAFCATLQVIDDLMTVSYTVNDGSINVKAVLKKKAGWLGVGMAAGLKYS